MRSIFVKIVLVLVLSVLFFYCQPYGESHNNNPQTCILAILLLQAIILIRPL
jgi:hypothetical protein